jgi:hypothetical protein
MLPTFLLPETVTRQNGSSADLALEKNNGVVQLTLGITRILEQESLEVTIWGSSDQQSWHQIAAFPQKFYCGNYPLLLDLTHHDNVRYLRANWKMDRWGNREPAPLFGFFLRAEEGHLHRHATAAN